MKYEVYVEQNIKYHEKIVANFEDSSAALNFMESVIRHCENVTVTLTMTNVVEEQEAEG